MTGGTEEDAIGRILLQVRTDEYGDSGNYNEGKLKAAIQSLLAEARIDETGHWLTLAQQSRDEHKPIAVINVKALIEQFEERLVELYDSPT